jgi:hypothetical protein
MDILYQSTLANNRFLTPEETKEEPTITYDVNDGLYTLLMHDPDASVGNYTHWLIINIPGNDVKKGETVFDYEGPGPLPNTGIHRYRFSLFQQREKIELAKTIDRAEPLYKIYDDLYIEKGEKPLLEAGFTSENSDTKGGSKNKKRRTTKKYKLTKRDYETLLKSYKIPIPKRNIERKAEKEMAKKLCGCIKKVGKEPRSIGICTGTIFNRRNLTRGKFQCRKERKVAFTKKNKKPI